MKCRSCNEELVPVFPTMEAEEGYKHYAGALAVKFDGGYGMYFDDLTQEQADALCAIVCAKCLNKLGELVPWIEEMFALHEKLYREFIAEMRAIDSTVEA